MPTIRPTKRLLMPVDERSKAILDTIIADQSRMRGVSHSDAILQDILDSQIPKTEFARFHVERVYADDCTVLGSISNVLRWNISGCVGTVYQTDYKPIIEFGLNLINRKGIAYRLDNNSTVNHHLRSRFEDTVEAYERATKEAEGTLSWLDMHIKSDCGRNLLKELDPEVAPRASASELLLFALEDFETLGWLNCACAYMCDIFEVLDDIDPESPGTHFISMQDTPEDRAAWANVLGETTAGWGRP
ncbi:Uncharacterised protein [Collinsella intestinalis]|nr:Uncharacterised protein [Collinsella intestinalis]